MTIKRYGSNYADIELKKEELEIILYWFNTSSKPNKEEKELFSNFEKLKSDIDFVAKTEKEVREAFNKM